MCAREQGGQACLISMPYPSGCVELNLHNVIDPREVTLQHDWNGYRAQNYLMTLNLQIGAGVFTWSVCLRLPCEKNEAQAEERY